MMSFFGVVAVFNIIFRPFGGDGERPGDFGDD